MVIDDLKDDPLWPNCGIRRTDFRPNFAGDLVNIYSTILPLETEDQTASRFIEISREMAAWVLNHRDKFGAEDRFQLIVGWPLSVHQGGRQVVKTGGTYSPIASGAEEVILLRGWSNTVF